MLPHCNQVRRNVQRWPSTLLFTTVLLHAVLSGQAHGDPPALAAEFTALFEQCKQVAQAQQIAAARETCKQAYERYIKQWPSNARAPFAAFMLRLLESLYERDGLLTQARSYGELELQLREEQAAQAQTELATALNSLAVVLLKADELGQAEPLLMRAVELFRKYPTKDPSGLVDALTNLTAVYGDLGLLSKSVSAGEEALQLLERSGSTEGIVTTLSNLGDAYRIQGRYALAEQTLLRALKEIKDVPESSIAPLNNLAVVYDDMGNYAAAEVHYRKSLAVLAKLPHRSREIPKVLVNLAFVLQEQGALDAAKSTLSEASSLLRGMTPPQPLLEATLLQKQAILYWRLGEQAKVEPLLRQSLRIERETLHLAENNRLVLKTVKVLAGWLEEQKGEAAKAEELYLQVLRGLKGSESANALALTSTYNGLGTFYYRQGRYKEAEAQLRRALELLERSLGPQHPDVIPELTNLGSVRMVLGDREGALALFERSFARQEAILNMVVTEPRALGFLTAQRDFEEMIYGMLLDANPSQAAVRLAMKIALLRKGRAVEIGARANSSLAGSAQLSAQVQAAYQRWRELTERHEHMIWMGAPQQQNGADPREQLDQLRRDLEQSHKELVEQGTALEPLLTSDPTQILRSVAQRLPQDGVLVEVVQTAPRLFANRYGQPVWGPRQYVAMLLFPDQRIVVVPLGLADSIDADTSNLLAALSDPKSEWAAASQSLYDKIFKKLAANWTSHTRVYLSLDGGLLALPFDALYNGSAFVLDKYELHYLTAGRDLLFPARKSSASTLAIFADPDYDASSVIVGRPPSPSANITPALCAATPRKSEAAQPRQATSGWFARISGAQRLRGTCEEARRLHELLPKTQVYLREEATEAALRRVKQPALLHIATHGVFIPQEPQRPAPPRASLALEAEQLSSSTNRTGILAGALLPRIWQPVVTPMSRAALLLAGAATGWERDDSANDGVLTAQEVVTLDMSQTQLVVLSACETGRGGIQVGQGVYGLQRAFLLAGAEAIVSSLWRISDADTGDLMVHFYRALLQKQSHIQALHQAMKEEREHHPHPYYWAPFMALGRDAPLSLPR